VILGLSLPTREAVDERYANLTPVGYAGRPPPFDAFRSAGRRSRRQWNQLMSPVNSSAAPFSEPSQQARLTTPAQASSEPVIPNRPEVAPEATSTDTSH
jgi:hypothetical protein